MWGAVRALPLTPHNLISKKELLLFKQNDPRSLCLKSNTK